MCIRDRLDSRPHEIAVEMTRRALGVVCIVDEEKKLLGIITDGDFRRHFANEGNFDATAEKMMTIRPVSTRPEATLDQVLKQMEGPERKIYVMPVVEEKGGLVGVVRMHDILGNS